MRPTHPLSTVSILAAGTGTTATERDTPIDRHLPAGEPLRHNAARYGEAIDGRMPYPSAPVTSVAVPATEYDERTRTADGTLRPGIALSRTAADHPASGVPAPERLIESIKTHTL